jgi:anti-anti-sigma regulatory factor
MEILKSEQYVVFKPENVDFDTILASKIEKSIAGMYSAEGKINFIIDLSKVKEFTLEGILLLNKVQKICKNESGLLVLVSTDDNIIDTISTHAEDFLLILPSQEEAIDAVFMNELENDFKDEHEDEYTTDGESDY